MACVWRNLLILLALIASATPLYASSREQRTFAAAAAEFQDRIYDRAEGDLIQYLQEYRKSTNAPQAALLLAQSQFYLGKFPNVIARLTDETNLARANLFGLGDRYVYWTAEARFASGDFSGAAATFASVPEKYPNSPLAVNAVVEAAAALERLGQWARADELLSNTNGVYQRMAVLDPAGEAVANGRLIQAEAKFQQQDFAGTIAILKLLNLPTLTPEQDWTRAHLLIQADLGRSDLDSALTVATNLVEIARHGHGNIWSANFAESIVIYATLLEQDGQLANAVSAWANNLSDAAPVEQQQHAILKIAELSDAQNNLADAESSLDKFVSKFPASPAADMALLTLGELHLKDFINGSSGTSDHLTVAQAKLTQFIGTYTNSPLIGKAILDRGWCFWLKGEYYDSMVDFKAAATNSLGNNDLAVAKFKTGDSLFALHRFSDSTNSYLAVLSEFAGVPEVMNSLAARAWYQVLRVQLEVQDVNGLDSTMQQFLGKYLTSAPADSSLLLAGQGFSSFGSPAKARSIFQTFEAERPASPLVPQVAFALGRTYEREQNWPAAVTNYDAWLGEFSTNELRPQVEYARNWAVAQTGDEPAAFNLFTNYLGRYTNALTPLALYWVADHYFRQGTNYQQANYYYQLVFQNFSTNELAGPALLMAGQSAMRLGSMDQAINNFLSKVIEDTNNPDSLRDQARFAYAEARRQMYMVSPDTNYVNLQYATNILGQMYYETPTNIAGALAWCDTGDFDQIMGALDGATNAYAQAFAAPSAPPELRNRAKVGFGLVLKKKAEGLPPDMQQPLLSLALDSFVDVVYNTNSYSDPYWTKKAAVEALPLMQLLQKGNLDRFVDSVGYWLPSLKDTLAKKRDALKNGPG